MITKDVYNGFMSIWYGERYVETIIKQFQFFSIKILTNLSIQSSSLNGFKILTQLLICNCHKKKMFHQGRKKSIVFLTGITGQKILNMGSCGFYFKTFSLLREIVLKLNQIISCCNQCSMFFISLNYKFNLMVMRCKKLDMVYLLKKKIAVIFMTSNRVITQRNKSYLFISNLLCFTMLVFWG